MDLIERSRFEGRIFLTPNLRAPWGVCTARKREVIFHLLVRGDCFVALGKDPSRRTERMLPGDLVIFPRGDAHTLCDDPDSAIISDQEMLQLSSRPPPGIRYGGGGRETDFICGAFSLSEIGTELLLDALPRKILLRTGDRADPQMEQIVRMVSIEHRDRNIGHQLIISGLLRILFVCILRHARAHAGQAAGGPLRALESPFLCEALKRIHSDYAREWSLESLASAVGVSRSKFAGDFKATVGRTPAKYVNLVRINEAERLILSTELSVKEIAHRVGFGSSEVLLRNFRARFGVTPGELRNRSRRSQG